MRFWRSFEWITAVRFLVQGKMQTAFILGGCALGVGVIVFMSAMLAGLQANFIRRVLTSQAHIQIVRPDAVARPLRAAPGLVEAAIVQQPTQRTLSLDQWQSTLAALEARDDIVTASPTVTGSALGSRGAVTKSLSVTGVDPAVHFRIVRIPDYLVRGEARLGSDDILIGTDLARDLGIDVGDKLTVTVSGGRARVQTITGLFDLGNRGANQRTVFVALRTAQSLFGMLGGASTIDLAVRDIYAAETIARDIEATLPVEADSWIRTNAQFFTAVRAQRNSNTVIRVFVGLSVAFGIAAVLIVSVIQRAKDIGILRAMGTRRGQVMRIFLIQGALLGLGGSLAGSALGGFGLILWHDLARQVDGSELFPLILEPSLFAAAAGLATLTGLAAAVAPALRAAGMDPVEAIRG
ncbi:ABC transporter permease [Prosthecomicrobium sp. N25]|uniref:ABC transporter permease n=1 Tax=Prosthecomicrobium sp. N25 TaxID=3129254 RepID=UPI0030782C2F